MTTAPLKTGDKIKHDDGRTGVVTQARSDGAAVLVAIGTPGKDYETGWVAVDQLTRAGKASGK